MAGSWSCASGHRGLCRVKTVAGAKDRDNRTLAAADLRSAEPGRDVVAIIRPPIRGCRDLAGCRVSGWAWSTLGLGMVHEAGQCEVREMGEFVGACLVGRGLLSGRGSTKRMLISKRTTEGIGSTKVRRDCRGSSRQIQDRDESVRTALEVGKIATSLCWLLSAPSLQSRGLRLVAINAEPTTVSSVSSRSWCARWRSGSVSTDAGG